MPHLTLAYKLPEEQQAHLRRAERIERLSIGFMLSIIALLGVTMGNSQAMKTLWLEDLLSLIPSVSFLVGARFRRKPPDPEYPYGYRRAILIAFLTGSVALFGLGGYMLIEALWTLASREHPTIQTVEIVGRHVWLGWLMIPALMYSIIPPFVLGRIKYKLAQELHDKALNTSGEINKGDWLSGVAGIAGLVGVAYGFWWADAAVAAFISVEIIKDGLASLQHSVAQLMNRRPRSVDSQSIDPLPEKLREALEGLAWVAQADVRLREEGDILTGEAFVVARDETDLLEKLAQAREVANQVHWRIHDVMLVPVRSV